MYTGQEFQNMAEFVKEYIESHDPIGTSLNARFPFRRRFEHCRRCSIWAQRIAPQERADVEICTISALFHDIGKSLETETKTHGEFGAEICEEYLTSIGFDEKKKALIVDIVRNHSNHEAIKNASLEAKVVSDTDVLDEKGAIGILWDAMAAANEEKPSYEKAYEHIVQFSGTLPESETWIHTETARQILRGRLDFLQHFTRNLEYELGYIEIEDGL